MFVLRLKYRDRVDEGLKQKNEFFSSPSCRGEMIIENYERVFEFFHFEITHALTFVDDVRDY